MLRRTACLLTAACLLAALPASAQAAITSVQKASAEVKPNKAGTKAKPQAISLTVRGYFDDVQRDIDAGTQFGMVNGRILLPKEGIHNMKQFPSCDPIQVFRAAKQCPAGSKVGTGTANGIGLGLDEKLTLQAFNLKGGKGIVVLLDHVPGAPVEIHETVVVSVKKLSGDPVFGYQLDFTLNDNLISPAPGVLAAVKDLKLTVPQQYLKKGGKYVKRKGQRIPYIATIGCPAGGAWQGRFTADYTTMIPLDRSIDSSQSVDVSVPCRK
jgi:hypothetical protein